MSVADARALVKMFAEDCVVHYGEFPVMRGKAELRPFVQSMFSNRLKEFVCQKTLRCLNGNAIGGTWTAKWVDAQDRQEEGGSRLRVLDHGRPAHRALGCRLQQLGRLTHYVFRSPGLMASDSPATPPAS